VASLSPRDLVGGLLVSIPDFPRPGILFRDLTPVLADAVAFKAIVDDLVGHFKGTFDAVAGVEARGFLLAAAAAYASGTSLIVVRKSGKLPGDVLTEHYDLEYGTDALELQPRRQSPASRVLILDDLLATGGTLTAASRLIERADYTVSGIGVVLELTDLGGRAQLAGHQVHSILRL
jgi:adenine phosphoribosyltransferase